VDDIAELLGGEVQEPGYACQSRGVCVCVCCV
jgi:hypothetical protein